MIIQVANIIIYYKKAMHLKGNGSLAWWQFHPCGIYQERKLYSHGRKQKAFLLSFGLGLSNWPSIYKKSAHHNTNKDPMSKTNMACAYVRVRSIKLMFGVEWLSKA